MVEQENWKYHARRGLIESVIKEIDVSENPNEVYLDVFYALSCCGLHMKAKKEGLFDRELWQKKDNIKMVLRDIKEFLWREIK